MLTVLLPHVYGVPGVAPLRVCGWPPDECLTLISSNPAPRSGQGPDNRRMNVWEALMNHWQDDNQMADLRDLLYHTLMIFRTGVDFLRLEKEPAWKVPRNVLQQELPAGLGHRQRGLHGNML